MRHHERVFWFVADALQWSCACSLAGVFSCKEAMTSLLVANILGEQRGRLMSRRTGRERRRVDEPNDFVISALAVVFN